jgi:ubiquinone/menaquinone biosynthesis C-methylase UbiE
MGLYNKYVLPRFLDSICQMKPLLEDRQRIVPLADGRVLEIGFGTGLNLPYYDANKVQRVIGIDPAEEMLDLARPRLNALRFPVELLPAMAEDIPLPDDSVDTVLVTFSLCTIPGTAQALQEMRRVLKPGGRLLFLEHGLAPDEGVAKWQGRINPLWRRLVGGCNLNRNTPQMLKSAGFRIETIEGGYMPDTPRFMGFRVHGVAMAG